MGVDLFMSQVREEMALICARGGSDQIFGYSFVKEWSDTGIIYPEEVMESQSLKVF